MNKLGLYTKFITHAGQRDSLVQLLLEAANGMQTVEGCNLYVVNIPDNEPDTIWVTELWSDPDAHQASLALEDAQDLIRRARPLIAGIEQIKLRPILLVQP